MSTRLQGVKIFARVPRRLSSLKKNCILGRPLLQKTFRNLNASLREIFKQAAKSAFDIDQTMEITASTKESFGAYQCNSALKLSKQFNLPPREIAEKLIEAVNDPHDMIKSCEVAGPGFINIHLKESFLEEELSQIAGDERLGVPLPDHKKRIVCEFSSPNVAKAMHVGHLRSTIIGDAIARLFEFLGHDVIRLNHIGDWGTQFGMLITYLKHFKPHVIEDASNESLEQLMEWYKEAKAKFDSSPTFKRESQEEVIKLQSGDPIARQAWTHICDISLKGFDEIYKQLNINIVSRGESYYNDLLPTVIQDFEEKGFLQIDDGAKVVFLEGFTNKEGNPFPLIIQKSDGGYNYATTDLAGFKQRIATEKAERVIIVTDAGQSLHFQMVYGAAVKVGYIDPAVSTFDHVTFGVVLAPTGKKFKTREGETERLSDLLDEAVERAKKALQERDDGTSTQEDIDRRARIIGIGSVKYADLCCNRVKDYTFSYERMLQFEGNTASFILYAYVRIQSIKNKIDVDIEQLMKEPKLNLSHPAELSLALHLRRFGEYLQAMDAELLPNRLTDYLFTLAEKFHAFFRDCRVEGDEKQNNRLVLIELAGRILAQGLNILGIETIDKM